MKALWLRGIQQAAQLHVESKTRDVSGYAGKLPNVVPVGPHQAPTPRVESSTSNARETSTRTIFFRHGADAKCVPSG
jgi:hypothetical protein